MHDQSGEHPRNHIGQLLFLRLFLFICGSASFFIHRSTFLTECVPLWTRIVILVLSFAVVIFLFKTVHSAFPEKNDSGQVISKSPFRYLRHPMSLACIVFYIGMSLSTMSLFSFALVLGIFFFYNYMADYEKNILTNKYGGQYIEYQQNTGKWFP